MRQKRPVHPGTATGRREGVHVESDHEQRALQPSALRKRKRRGQARPGAAATHAGDQRHTGREPAHRPPRQRGLLGKDGLQGQTASQQHDGEIRASDQRQVSCRDHLQECGGRYFKGRPGKGGVLQGASETEDYLCPEVQDEESGAHLRHRHPPRDEQGPPLHQGADDEGRRSDGSEVEEFRRRGVLAEAGTNRLGFFPPPTTAAGTRGPGMLPPPRPLQPVRCAKHAHVLGDLCPPPPPPPPPK